MRHRVQFDCEEGLFHDLNALIPRGVKRFVLECVCQALVDKLKSGNRTDILSEVMRKRFAFDDMLSMEMLDGLKRSEAERERHVERGVTGSP